MKSNVLLVHLLIVALMPLVGCDEPTGDVQTSTHSETSRSPSNNDELSTRQQAQSTDDPILEIGVTDHGLPDNAIGAAIEYHLAVASGDGTINHHEAYYNSILELKEFEELVPVLVDASAAQQDTHLKLDLVYVLADIDDCAALPHLEDVAVRSHPELGREPCHNCGRENEIELSLTLEAITGVGRLLLKSCNEEAETALENIALNAQTPTGRWAAVANLKIEAGRSQQSLEELLPAEEDFFAAVRAWNPDDERSPEPDIPAELETENAPEL